jgi:hypothetical protein
MPLRISGLLQAPSTWVTAFVYVLGLLRSSNADGDPRDCSARLRYPSTLVRYRTLTHGYLIAAVAVALITSARSGANVNYWLEASAAMAIVTPTLWVGVRARSRRWRAWYVIAVIALGLATLVLEVRVLRGEWFHWRARAYFDEVVSTIERITPEGSPVFSVYPELATAAGRPYYFNDFVQYDGRSPQHQRLLEEVLESGDLAAIVTHQRASPGGYRFVPLSRAVPEKVYPVFVHALDSRGTR